MSDKKERLQFYISPEANRQLNIVSESLGVSKAELIREGVDKLLKEKLPLEKDPAYQLKGIIKKGDIGGGKSNIAENHDIYLYRNNKK